MQIMKILIKWLLVVFFAAVVIGFCYFLTLISPGKSVKAPTEYIDPSVESAQLLKESEELESEFEKAASVGMLSAGDVDKLRKAIRLQEIYIEKARATSSDNTPMERLTALRTRLQNIEAEPLSRLVADFERNAKSSEASGDSIGAEKFYRQAYDIQDKINRAYWLSKYKNVTKVVELDKAVKNLEVRPMYEKSLEAEKNARAALTRSDWKTAVAEFEKAVQISRDISVRYPTSGYNDYMRLQRIRSEIDSLKSSDVKVEIDKLIEDAKALLKKGEYAAASDKYSLAAQRQKDINTLFPRSAHASEEKFSEYSNLSSDAKSKIYVADIKALDRDFTAALQASDISKASDISSNLVARVEQFKNDFPRNADITSEDLIRVRYLNFAMGRIAEIQKSVNALLLPIGSGKKMLKTEVSQKLYKTVMQENPSRNQSSEDNPVESATYGEALTFCQRLGWILGRKVSLPSAKEFENAVGNLRYADIDAISWNASNSGGSVHKVATKKANDKGFFDLLGNVEEFVSGETSDGSVTVMGGDAQTSVDSISSLPSSKTDMNRRNRMLGFRIIVSE